MKRISVVILNWNGVEMLRRYLPSVLSFSPEADVIVADNNSTDESVTVLRTSFPDVRIIELDRNYGFAEGYNRALRNIDTEYYVLLNSDVRVVEGWLEPMLSYLDTHPKVAACQPKLRCDWSPEKLEYAGAAGGYIDRLGYPFCRGRIMNSNEKDEGQYDQVATIAWASGAALFIRSKAYWEVGGLDGRFFAHQEEIDLCWRLRSRGYDIICQPESVVYHYGGGTLPKESPRKTYLNFRNNLLLIYKNMPDECLTSVMWWRLLLDLVAALQFFLLGKLGSGCAVFRARRDFRTMRARFYRDRKLNQMLSVTPVEQIVSPYAILWQYFVRGRRTFSALPKRK